LISNKAASPCASTTAAKAKYDSSPLPENQIDHAHPLWKDFESIQDLHYAKCRMNSSSGGYTLLRKHMQLLVGPAVDKIAAKRGFYEHVSATTE